MDEYMNHVSNFPEEKEDITKYKDYKKEYIDRIRRSIAIDSKQKEPKLPKGVLINELPIAHYVIDPTLIDKRGIKYIITDCYGVTTLIPGSGYSWESIYHLEYFMLCVIRTTEAYEVMYDIKKESEIRRMMKKFTDKNKIVGLACQIRDSDKTMTNRILNDICHCRKGIDKTPSYIRLSKNADYFKGEWTEDQFDRATDHLIEILENNQHLTPLLEDKEASLYAHRVDIIWRMNKALRKVTDLNRKHMLKIEETIIKSGGTLDYVNQHCTMFSARLDTLEVTKDLYNELQSKLEANWAKIGNWLKKEITTIRNKHVPLLQRKLDDRAKKINSLPTTFIVPGLIDECIRNDFQ